MLIMGLNEPFVHSLHEQQTMYVLGQKKYFNHIEDRYLVNGWKWFDGIKPVHSNLKSTRIHVWKSEVVWRINDFMESSFRFGYAEVK